MSPEVLGVIVLIKACIAIYVFIIEDKWSDKILWPMMIFFIPMLGLLLYFYSQVPKRRQVSRIKNRLEELRKSRLEESDGMESS